MNLIENVKERMLIDGAAVLVIWVAFFKPSEKMENGYENSRI